MRADKRLVELGHYESRARAQAAIKAGLVSINGRALQKPSDKIPEDADVQAGKEHPYVSRGGLKLAHALAHFGVDPRGKVCLDIGSSTGGFTQVLLLAGAEHIYAVDVGHGQLHESLRGHAQITSMERQDARTLNSDMLSQTPTLLVCDASFISLTKVLGTAMALLSAGDEMITLVKPQFEVGKQGIGKGGLVLSPQLAQDSLEMVKNWTTEQGWTVLGTTNSPIKGGSGNREYLLHARKQ